MGKGITAEYSWAYDLVEIRLRLYWVGRGIKCSDEVKGELQFQWGFLQLEGRDYGFF